MSQNTFETISSADLQDLIADMLGMDHPAHSPLDYIYGYKIDSIPWVNTLLDQRNELKI